VRLLIDTNVIVDVAMERQPYLQASEQILLFVEQGSLDGYISASTFTDLYYIIRKARGHGWTLEFLTQLLTFCKIATVDQNVIDQALVSTIEDFEDAVQYETAVANQLAAIVTRNSKDFPTQGLQVFTPEALLQRLSQSESQSF
jgi:predicted nucleic acid-binding protein